jgi:aminodeoxyfutalosine synthase
LWYGADDCDGTVLEYEITYEPGKYGYKNQALTPENMRHMIREAGRTPVERDSHFHEIPFDETEDGPRGTRIPLPVVG